MRLPWCIISPDLKVEYANTGSAFVWEMFDSTAYDAGKFAAMLDRADERFQREKTIRADKNVSDKERDAALTKFHGEVRKAVDREGLFRLPPSGFTVAGAEELFRLTGDLKQKK